MKINQRLTLCFSLLFCLLSISYASAQQLNISGVVISSEDNEPLIGATVSVKGIPPWKARRGGRTVRHHPIEQQGGNLRPS